MFVSNRTTPFAKSGKITFADVLIEDVEWKSGTPFHDRLMHNEAYNMKMHRVEANGILMTIQDIFSMKDSLSYANLLAKFRETVLHPAHKHFGMLEQINFQLHDKIKLLAEEVISNLFSSEDINDNDKLSLFMNTTCLLSDLGISAALPTYEYLDPYAVLGEVICVIRRWDSWLTLSIPKRAIVFNWLHSLCDSIDDPLSAFVHKILKEQARILMHELKEGSEDIRSSSCASSLVNLRIEPNVSMFDDNSEEEQSSKRKTPIVTFYSVQAMPIGLRFARGEHVQIYKQPPHDVTDAVKEPMEYSVMPGDYEEEFPALSDKTESKLNSDDIVLKDACCCLGRVVSVAEAPLSIKIKLIAPSYIADPSYVPDPIQECLTQKKGTWFELRIVPANVSVLSTPVIFELVKLSHFPLYRSWHTNVLLTQFPLLWNQKKIIIYILVLSSANTSWLAK